VELVGLIHFSSRSQTENSLSVALGRRQSVAVAGSAD
jgi:hypothetical protein